MEKIEFIIPKTKNISKNVDIKKENNEISDINKYKNTVGYRQISPNLYRFNTSYINQNDDIYLMYNNACDLKKTDIHSAINVFKKCYELITNDIKHSIQYEICINLSLLLADTNGSYEEIEKYYKKAINIFSDRSEPYYYWAIYCNKQKKFEKAYELLTIALSLKYEDAIIKYPETQRYAYDKYLFDELAVSCFWLKKYNESKSFLEKIIDEPDFSSSRERLLKNLKFTNEELEKYVK